MLNASSINLNYCVAECGIERQSVLLQNWHTTFLLRVLQGFCKIPTTIFLIFLLPACTVSTISFQEQPESLISSLSHHMKEVMCFTFCPLQ